MNVNKFRKIYFFLSRNMSFTYICSTMLMHMVSQVPMKIYLQRNLSILFFLSLPHSWVNETRERHEYLRKREDRCTDNRKMRRRKWTNQLNLYYYICDFSWIQLIVASFAHHAIPSIAWLSGRLCGRAFIPQTRYQAFFLLLLFFCSHALHIKHTREHGITEPKTRKTPHVHVVHGSERCLIQRILCSIPFISFNIFLLHR